MEILAPNLIDTALRVAIIAALMSAAVLVVCIAVRWNFDRQVKRAARFRRQAEPLITAYVAGRSEDGELTRILRRAPAEALPLLMEISDRLEPDERPRLQPLFAALELTDKETARLKHWRWEMRLRAAERLGYLGDPASAPALRAALQDEVLAVRFAAARALVALGDEEALEPILLAFDLPGDMNQRRVAEILYSFGPGTTDRLLAIVQNPQGTFSDSAVCTATRVLGMLRAKKAIAPLADLLTSPEFRIRLHATRALGLLGDRSVLPQVDLLTEDPSWEVRNVAVQAVGKLGAPADVPRLQKALGDQAWWVRFSAGSALYDLGDSGIDALRDTMNTSTDRYARDISRQILEENRVSETHERKL